MSSNRPYTFDDAAQHLLNADEEVWSPRPNTTVRPSSEDLLALNVYVYGSHCATMFSDGTVKLEASPDMSNTTRNRMNDILAPLRWKLRKINGTWYLETKGHLREYVTGMIVAPVNNGKRN